MTTLLKNCALAGWLMLAGAATSAAPLAPALAPPALQQQVQWQPVQVQFRWRVDDNGDNGGRRNGYRQNGGDAARGPRDAGQGRGGERGREPAYGQRDDAGPRQGRMSQEERRALRQQIDEAGHDIYRGRR